MVCIINFMVKVKKREKHQPAKFIQQEICDLCGTVVCKKHVVLYSLQLGGHLKTFCIMVFWFVPGCRNAMTVRQTGETDGE